MSRLKIPFVLLLLTLLPRALPAQSPAPAQRVAPSAEMRAILAALRSGPDDLDISGLPRMGKEAAAAFIANGMDGMETCHLPEPTSGADYFTYTVYYDKAQGKYWVRRNGGFAGVNELYGPMTAPAAPK